MCHWSCPPALTKRTGGVALVALALPRVRAARVRRLRPHAPDGHAVVVDVDVPLFRAAHSGALPAVGIAAEQVCRPASAVLEVAGLTQVTLIQAAGVAGGIGRHRSREHCAHGDRARRKCGREFPLETHVEPFLLEASEGFLRTFSIIAWAARITGETREFFRFLYLSMLCLLY